MNNEKFKISREAGKKGQDLKRLPLRHGMKRALQWNHKKSRVLGENLILISYVFPRMPLNISKPLP